MSEHYCIFADRECDLDIDEAYEQGRADAIEEYKELLKEDSRTYNLDWEYYDEITAKLREEK